MLQFRSNVEPMFVMKSCLRLNSFGPSRMTVNKNYLLKEKIRCAPPHLGPSTGSETSPAKMDL